MLDGGIDHVVAAVHIGIHGLHGEEIAGWHLLQCRGVKHEIDALHHRINTLSTSNIADMKFEPRLVQLNPHQFLLQFVSTKDTDFPHCTGPEYLHEGLTE
ncbi:MAG: hypothetical protein JW384_03766 [Nitrosomonadaceae bacterium]|nr:hypothetical protein [Nitrosomonadaceae bacterium]